MVCCLHSVSDSFTLTMSQVKSLNKNQSLKWIFYFTKFWYIYLLQSNFTRKDENQDAMFINIVGTQLHSHHFSFSLGIYSLLNTNFEVMALSLRSQPVLNYIHDPSKMWFNCTCKLNTNYTEKLYVFMFDNNTKRYTPRNMLDSVLLMCLYMKQFL